MIYSYSLMMVGGLGIRLLRNGAMLDILQNRRIEGGYSSELGVFETIMQVNNDNSLRYDMLSSLT